MKTQKDRSTDYEFYVRDLDNLILVEASSQGVTIRATRDNFPERRKRNFIRTLAAEGFIPDEYQWFNSYGSAGGYDVRWVIDTSWIRPSEGARRISGRFMRRLLVGSAVLWLILMTGAVVLGGRHLPNSPASPKSPTLAGTAEPNGALAP